MKKSVCVAALIAAAAGLGAAPAQAGVDELRLGVVYHNIRTEEGDLAEPKEDGPNVEGELVWTSPGFLEFFGAPRPYTMVSVNTQGNTSFAAVGLYWRINLGDKWAFEPGFGYAVHDGENDIPEEFPDGSPQAAEFEREHQLLGSTDLFRTSFALEREYGDHGALQFYYEHLSHGQILGDGRNQGLDEVGFRYIFRFRGGAAQ